MFQYLYPDIIAVWAPCVYFVFCSNISTSIAVHACMCMCECVCVHDAFLALQMCGEEQSQAYRYLANYHVKQGQLDDAYTAALKCTEFTEVGCCNVYSCSVPHQQQLHHLNMFSISTGYISHDTIFSTRPDILTNFMSILKQCKVK